MREIPPPAGAGASLAASDQVALRESPALAAPPLPAAESRAASRLRVAIDARKLRDPESGVGSYIVNLDCVGEIEPLDTGDARVAMRDGTALPCSRTYRDALRIGTAA